MAALKQQACRRRRQPIFMGHQDRIIAAARTASAIVTIFRFSPWPEGS